MVSYLIKLGRLNFLKSVYTLMSMSSIPKRDDVVQVTEPIARSYLGTVQDELSDTDASVSDIGEREEAGTVGWDIAIERPDGTVVVVGFNVLDSVEYEGQMTGYNVIVNAVAEDGKPRVHHPPHSRTDEAWTTDLDELRQRAEGIPPLKKENILS